MERRHFQPDKVADDFEDIGPPLASFFAFFGSLVSSLRAEDNPEKSDCRQGTPEILQEMEI